MSIGRNEIKNIDDIKQLFQKTTYWNHHFPVDAVLDCQSFDDIHREDERRLDADAGSTANDEDSEFVAWLPVIIPMLFRQIKDLRERLKRVDEAVHQGH